MTVRNLLAKTDTVPASEGRTPVPVTNRIDFLFLFDVTNGNPNGDPENGGAPRVDPETSQGLVSDVAMKRKVRDMITKQLDVPGNRFGVLPRTRYDIFMRSDAVLNDLLDDAYRAIGAEPGAKKKKGKRGEQAEDAEGEAEAPKVKKAQKGAGKDDTRDRAQKWLLERYFDIRAFGAMLETGDSRAGHVKGAVWFGTSKSVDKVYDNEFTITRKAVTRSEDSDKTGTIGKKSLVSYGLYVMAGSIDPVAAQASGFDKDDLAQLWDALQMMFEHDKSACRGEMHAQKLFVFEHNGPFNKVPSHKLLDRVQIAKKVALPRKFGDYEVAVNLDGLPDSVTFSEML